MTLTSINQFALRNLHRPGFHPGARFLSLYRFPCSSPPPDSQIGPELSGISLGILGRYQYLVKPHKSHTSRASAFEFGDAADKGPGTRFCLRVPAPPPPIFWSETFIPVDIKFSGGRSSRTRTLYTDKTMRNSELPLGDRHL